MRIWWIRRDLRLGDNLALTLALQNGLGVLPVFILDDHLLTKPAEKRHAFLFAGLRALEIDLQALGSGLVVRRGNPAAEIPRLARESGADVVFAEEDVSPYALRRDEAVGRQVDLRLVSGLGAHPTSAIARADGRAYTIFTPFSRAWKALPLSEQVIPAPTFLPPIPDLPSDVLPCLNISIDFPPGEREAKRRLATFLDGPIFNYETNRNRMDFDGTSLISPYLRFGMISARSTVAALKKIERSAPDMHSRASCEVWLNELIWREFYQSILYHFPEVLSTAFRPAMRNIPWRNSPDDLQAWQSGHTGYPIVDAAMRQLATTGWMHNRARMITASFLVKHLLINWQEGERWFMHMLVDGDPAANNGGWQWTAGTGTDAAPYFRIFNPILQGKKYDPQGIFVRRWIPELDNVPQKFIHAPWEMPDAEQRKFNVVIGRDYPAPIIDLSAARQRALVAYSV